MLKEMISLAKTKKEDIPEEQLETAAPEETKEPAPAESAPSTDAETALKAEKDRYLRLAAEFDNYRKRSTKERESLYSDIQADTIVQLLPVYDNLARALSQECADEAFYRGVEMTMTQLKEILDKLGVAEIKAVGEKFDPERHNAVMHVEDPAYGEGIITDEFEKGFILGSKVIRFSMVKVAN